MFTKSTITINFVHLTTNGWADGEAEMTAIPRIGETVELQGTDYRVSEVKYTIPGKAFVQITLVPSVV